jgi:hypothetical protein
MRPTFFCLVAAIGLAPLLPAADRPKVLDRQSNIDRPVEQAPLKDILEFMEDKFGLSIGIDQFAFRKAGINDVRDRTINLPRMTGVSVAFVLEAAAQQVDGTVQVDDGRITIKPGKGDLAALLPPEGKALTKKLAVQVTLEKDLSPSKFGDLIEHFRGQTGVQIVVADWQFPAPAKAVVRPNGPQPGDSSRVNHLPCRLAAGTESLQTWLEKVAGQVGGIVVPRDNVVLIVPGSKEAGVNP